MRIFGKILMALTVLYGISMFGWKLMEHFHRLSHVPEEMNVSTIVYAKQEAWGFGPSGKEAGFIMYALPEGIAVKTEQGGIGYLSSFPSAHLGWQEGRYHSWYMTPHDHERGIPLASRSERGCGFCIDIDPKAEALFQQAISSPGSFYSYGRVGMILVAPSIRKVFYIYRG